MSNIFEDLEILTVTFKSEHIIDSCLSKIDDKFKITIVENSNNLAFKKRMEGRNNFFIFCSRLTKYMAIVLAIIESSGMVLK